MTEQDELDRALLDLREQLRAAHGDAGASPVGPVLAAARARLMAEAAPVAVRRRRHRPVAVAAAAVVAALVVGGILVSSPGTTPAAAPVDARAVLELAAAQTTDATDPVLGPGQYRYIETRSWGLTAGTDDDGHVIGALAEYRTQYWMPADLRQDGLAVSGQTGEHQWVVGTEADAHSINLAPDEPERITAPCARFYSGSDGICDGPGSWSSPTPAFLAGLPRDPAQLLTRLEHDAPVDDQGKTELLNLALGLLRNPVVLPADLRSALYLALSRIDGLTRTPGSVNLDGRPGTALGFDNGTHRTEIIVDPDTGEFIGEREVVTSTSLEIPTGTVTGYTSVSTGVADHIGGPPVG
jgi:hypothetical protein